MAADFDPRLSPSRQGFRMPAEWEPHRATWLSWPHKEASWPGNFAPIPAVFAQMALHLSRGEQVYINAGPEELRQSAEAELRRAGVDLSRVRFFPIPTDDAWVRDHGPIFLTRTAGNGETEYLILDWGYNAWGGKYPPFDQDDVVPRKIASALGLPCRELPMILEGGSIEVNGRGALLTTEACLLNPNRNPGMKRGEIETQLRAMLNVNAIWWLGEGIAGDDTDGHVDDLARFTAPDTIVTVVEEDPEDENYQPLQDNLRRLGILATQHELRIETLPMPPAVIYENQRLPASYANFYIANSVVLVPTFNCPADALALATLARLFPTRQVIGVGCREMVWGLGTCHCATQQQPF